MPGRWWAGSSGDYEFEVVGYQTLSGERFGWYRPGVTPDLEAQYSWTRIRPSTLANRLRSGDYTGVIVEVWKKGDREASSTLTVHAPFRGQSIRDVLRLIRIAIKTSLDIYLTGLEDDNELLESAGESVAE